MRCQIYQTIIYRGIKRLSTRGFLYLSNSSYNQYISFCVPLFPLCLYYTTLLVICQAFLGNFFSSFSTKFCEKKVLNLVILTNSGPHVCKGPAIIPHLRPTVKGFLKNFFRHFAQKKGGPLRVALPQRVRERENEGDVPFGVAVDFGSTTP